MTRTGVNWPRDLLTHLFHDEVCVAVLRHLVRFPRGDSGRTVAELTGYDKSRVNRALRRLEGLGIVSRRPVGRAHSCQLAQDNQVVQRLVLPLFQAEEALAESVIRRIVAAAGKDSLEALVLYGSLARQEAAAESDVDLLVVLKNGHHTAREHDDIVRACGELSTALGRPIEPVVRDLAGLKEWSREGHPLWRTILSEGVSLYGSTIGELAKDVGCEVPVAG